VFLDREPFCEPAQRVWTLAVEKELVASISALSISHAFFIIQKCASSEKAYEAIEVETGGAVEGAVTFVGAAPAPRKLLVAKDPEVCGSGERVIEDVSVAEGGGLRHVVGRDVPAQGREAQRRQSVRESVDHGHPPMGTGTACAGADTSSL